MNPIDQRNDENLSLEIYRSDMEEPSFSEDCGEEEAEPFFAYKTIMSPSAQDRVQKQY